MKKILLAFALLIGLAAPAAAAEHVGDTATLTLETGVTRVNATTLAFSNVWAKRAYKADPTIIKGHTYSGTVTVSGYSGTGSLEAYVTGIKMSCGSGAWVNSPNGINGEFDVPDNFTSSLGVVSDPTFVFGDGGRETDPNGAFRFSFNMGKVFFLPDDPMVCPAAPGTSHLHQFMGNTGTNAYSTYHSLRTTGGTNAGDSRYPLNRAAYWQPAMFDGAGHVVMPCCELTYYKAIPMGIPECQGAPDATHIAYCIELPNGLRFIAGCDMANMPRHCPVNAGDPTDPEASAFVYQCHGHGFRATGDANDNISYKSIEAARSSGNPNCAVGATNYLYLSLQAPTCWDGTHLDSPNHRDHVAYVTGGLNEYSNVTATGVNAGNISVNGAGLAKCPTTHPYQFPSLALQEAFKIDVNFVGGHWHLSCDEQMGSSWPAGACLHMDYWEAWSRYAKDRWTGNATTFTGCENARYSCNYGQLGDGSKITFEDGGGSTDLNKMMLTTPRNRVGWSRPMSANGTYTFELKAVSDGELGLYGVGGFSATGVTFTITDVTNTGKAQGVSVQAN